MCPPSRCLYLCMAETRSSHSLYCAILPFALRPNMHSCPRPHALDRISPMPRQETDGDDGRLGCAWSGLSSLLFPAPFTHSKTLASVAHFCPRSPLPTGAPTVSIQIPKVGGASRVPVPQPKATKQAVQMLKRVSAASNSHDANSRVDRHVGMGGHGDGGTRRMPCFPTAGGVLQRPLALPFLVSYRAPCLSLHQRASAAFATASAKLSLRCRSAESYRRL